MMEKFWQRIKQLIIDQEIETAIEEINEYQKHGLIEGSRISELLLQGLIDEALEAMSQKNSIALDDKQIFLEGIKTKIHMAEIELSVLHSRISKIRSELMRYHVRHYEVLHETISRLLFLRKEIAYLKMERDQNIDTHFEDYNKEYHEYHEQEKPSCQTKECPLSEEELKELNKLYRQGVKRCHPDLLNEEQQEQANKVFILLKFAFENFDLDKVKEICMQLENGELGLTAENEYSEVNRLKNFHARLKREIIEKQGELQQIEGSTVYKTLKFIPDVETHLLYLKNRFLIEIEELEKEFNDLSA